MIKFIKDIETEDTNDCNAIYVAEENKKRAEESEEEYIYRICEKKDIIGNWYDVRDILNKELGYEYTESKYRKTYQAYCKLFNSVGIKQVENKEYEAMLDEKRILLEKEKYKYFDQRNAYNASIRGRARQEELNEIIKSTIESGELRQLDIHPIPKAIKNKTAMLVSFNDLHCGADINNAWNEYNTDILKKRISEYLSRIISIQEKEQCSEAVVWCNGDMISGLIHKDIRITNRENIIEQVMLAAELISLFLEELSKHFNKIRYVSISGNHSRLEKWEDSLKGERLDMLVSWYVEARLKDIKNIDFTDYKDIDSTMYSITILDKVYVGIHGDYDRGVDKLLSLQQMTNEKVYCILSGHLHHNKCDTYQNIKTIMAGSFMGVDDFCITKRILGKPEQMVTVVNNDGIICNYEIILHEGLKF